VTAAPMPIKGFVASNGVPSVQSPTILRVATTARPARGIRTIGRLRQLSAGTDRHTQNEKGVQRPRRAAWLRRAVYERAFANDRHGQRKSDQHDIAIVAAGWNIKQRCLIRRNSERTWAGFYEPAHLRYGRCLPGCEIEETDRSLAAVDLAVRDEVYATRGESPLPEKAGFGQRRDTLFPSSTQIQRPDSLSSVAFE
jgi:hypothetical protein